MVTAYRELSINKKQFEDHLASFFTAASLVDDNEDIKSIEFEVFPDRIACKLKIRKEVEGKTLRINGEEKS